MRIRFRAAVEAGLTVISHWGNEQILSDMAARPAPNFADIVPNPNGAPLKFVTTLTTSMFVET